MARARRKLRRAAEPAVLGIAALGELRARPRSSSDCGQRRRDPRRARRGGSARRRAAGRRPARARCPRRRRAGCGTRRPSRRAGRGSSAGRTAARAGSTCRGSTAARRAGRTPTAASRRPRPAPDRVHVDRVDVGALLAIDLDVDEQLVHQLRGRRRPRSSRAPSRGTSGTRRSRSRRTPACRAASPRRTPPRPTATSRPGCRRAAAGTASSRRRGGSACRGLTPRGPAGATASGSPRGAAPDRDRSARSLDPAARRVRRHRPGSAVTLVAIHI